MSSGERDLATLIGSMRPVLHDGAFVFTTTTTPVPTGVRPVVTVAEPEGLTLVLERQEADRLDLPYGYVAAMITLQVHSALDAVGLTAAVSQELARHGISANVVAGYFHDHVFVPHGRGDEAVAHLAALADRQGRDPRTPGRLRPTQAVAQLSVRRGREAVAFYVAAFGAVEVYRVGGTDQHPSVVSQLVVDGATFWVSDEAPSYGHHSPESLSGTTFRMLLVAADPEEVVRAAVDAGAWVVAGVDAQHGWLLGVVEDPFGHRWEIGRPLVDWPPAGHSHG